MNKIIESYTVGNDHQLDQKLVYYDCVASKAHAKMLGKLMGNLPAPYLDGLESPADSKNLVRGPVARGYTDSDVKKIVGGNALNLFRQVMG